jgi:magnesium transporter
VSEAPASRALVTCIDYGPDRVERQEVRDTAAFLSGHRQDGTRVRWINVDGLSDPALVRAIGDKYGLHPLALEDVLTPNQRPKFEPYEAQGEHKARVFVIARMLELSDGHLQSEQISLFLGHNTVLTFQEAPGDIWDPVRQRIDTPGSRLRASDASFLFYSLLDAIVDNCFPVLERFGERLEQLEELVLDKPSRQAILEIHAVKRELLVLRRAVWPMREVVQGLQREPHACVSDNTRTYLRDLYDHAVQIMDILETYRDVATSLTETYMSSMSNRMNEVMKVLTIIGTIFIPLTFLAGVYGMNMPIPENQWKGSYPIFWIVCLVVAGGMVAWFKRRDWL